MSFIYLIKCDGFYKIGVASDVEDRLARLQTGNPIKLQVVGKWQIKQSKEVEGRLHTHFSKCRVNGEWFNLTDGDVHILTKAMEIIARELAKRDATTAEEHNPQ